MDHHSNILMQEQPENMAMYQGAYSDTSSCPPGNQPQRGSGTQMREICERLSAPSGFWPNVISQNCTRCAEVNAAYVELSLKLSANVINMDKMAAEISKLELHNSKLEELVHNLCDERAKRQKNLEKLDVEDNSQDSKHFCPSGASVNVCENSAILSIPTSNAHQSFPTSNSTSISCDTLMDTCSNGSWEQEPSSNPKQSVYKPSSGFSGPRRDNSNWMQKPDRSAPRDERGEGVKERDEANQNRTYKRADTERDTYRPGLSNWRQPTNPSAHNSHSNMGVRQDRNFARTETGKDWQNREIRPCKNQLKSSPSNVNVVNSRKFIDHCSSSSYDRRTVENESHQDDSCAQDFGLGAQGVNEDRCLPMAEIGKNRRSTDSRQPKPQLRSNPSNLDVSDFRRLPGQSSRSSYDPHSVDGGSLPIKEIRSDLFRMTSEYALAHCVGSDLIMSSGIAVQFRKKFRNVPELLDQNKNPGEVAFLKVNDQYIYYLVTKLTSTGKPSWNDFEKSVKEWSVLCRDHGVKKIAIPKLGCGRDLLEWSEVRQLLIKYFSNSGIEITVCLIDGESFAEKKWNLKLKHTKSSLASLDPRECAFVFIASKDRYVTETVRQLGTKFGFLSDYTSHELAMSGLYHCKTRNVFGLVVKECHTDPVSFTSLSICFQLLKKAMKKSNLWYLGIEAFDDPKFLIPSRKLWTVLIDVFFVDDIEVYFCWPESVKEKCWEEQRTQ